jgi:hypothetical protein
LGTFELSSDVNTVVPRHDTRENGTKDGDTQHRDTSHKDSEL